MKLLIGYDGSDCARAAIEDLVLAGLPAKVDALILSVADMLIKVPYEEYFPPADAGHRPMAKLVRAARALAADAMNQAQEAAMEGVELVTSLFPGWKVESETVADAPYWGMIKKSEQWAADLILLGSHGRSMLGHLVLGSVSQNVLSHASCSVRIARTRERSASAPTRIILGVDGSRSSNIAVDLLEQREWPPGTEVRVLTAVDPQLSMAIAYHFACQDHAGGGDNDDVVSTARHHAESIVRRLKQSGLAASATVESGDPKRFLIDEARSWNADCIFVGAKGHRRLERFLLGSVSAAVAARAGCTVEVVRP